MKDQNRLYVDIHILQTIPPSCINRDDTGSPKTAIYGGATRARVSSQSWKRAMRLMFKEIFPHEKLGVRTKKIVHLIADEIRKLDASADAEQKAEKILTTAGLKIKSADKGTDALFFMSVAQAKALAEYALVEPESVGSKPAKEHKENALELLRHHPGIDIALFGRMVADNPSINTDACAQVAHSISTHKINNEYDYFTAVDDMAPEDNAGAAHIDTNEYNAATLYRYATVAVHELHKHLGNETAEVMCQFIRAFCCSMPTGKQNSYANRTLPDCMMVTVRNDQPINLVGAFEKPVPASDEGYVIASAKRLTAHAQSVYTDFANAPEAIYTVGSVLAQLGETMTLHQLLERVRRDLNALLEIGGNDK